MHIVLCDTSYAEPILAILNDAICHSTALYDYQPRTMADMQTWFEVKAQHHYPVIGLVDDHNTLLGFATYGTFRAFAAYKYTVEHSLYVHKDYRGQGLGKVLLAELVKHATAQNKHCLVAGIDAANTVSIALHQQAGFTYCGTIKQAGYKFAQWLDLDFYQLLLPTPAEPNEA